MVAQGAPPTVKDVASASQPLVPSGSQPAASASADGAGAQQELQAARAKVRANPSDARSHFNLAELLRRAGRHREAAQEYLEVVDLEPANYYAYHMLSAVNADPAQVEEGVTRLERLKEEKPKDLMLRVALSELLEKRGNYYQAARQLVDLVYQNAVPEKYHQKINARIHYLLSKAKDAQSKVNSYIAEEELDSSPPPLPESSLRKDLTVSKLKEPRVMKGAGNAPLLP
jgi:tetratricopeptide (TPR) repeat protein